MTKVEKIQMLKEKILEIKKELRLLGVSIH